MLAFLAFLVPKLYFGVKTMCKKFQKVGSIWLDLAQVQILTTPSNLLSGNGAKRIYSIVKTTWFKTRRFGDLTLMNCFGSHPVW